MPDIKLFVGFGGSGGKTLAAMAELIADDALLADHGERYFYFLLADTDQADIDRAERKILEQFARVKGAQPFVAKLVLSRGAGRVMDLIHDSMGDQLKWERQNKQPSPELEALRKHWPFDREGVPFSAPRLPGPLTQGASQCPLAAHLAAWDSLSRGPMRKALQDVQDAMVKNLHEMNNDTQVNLILVGSLAGGTGRGCWQLLSLAARSVFTRCKPQAYFFDSMVFDRNESSGRRRLRKHVNSLTGLSEVAGWLRNDLLGRDGGRQRFALPSLRASQYETLVVDTDTIAHAVNEPQLTGRSPIDGVLVFSGGSDAVSVEDPEDAYGIAAAALFARIAIPELQSTMVNDIIIGSCGAAIAKVHVTAIQECVRLRAQIAVTDQIVADDAVESRLSSSKVLLPVAFDAASAADFTQAPDGSLLGLVCGGFDDVDVDQLSRALKDQQSLDDVINAARQLPCMKAQKSTVRQFMTAAVNAKLETPSATDWKSAFRKAVLRELQRLFAAKASAGTLESALLRLEAGLESLKKCLPDLASFVATDPVGELRASVQVHAGLEYGLFGARWNEQEQATILQEVKSRSAKVHAAAVAELLYEMIGDWAQIVQEYLAAVRPTTDAARQIGSSGRIRFDAMRKEHFLPNDFAELQLAFGDWTSRRAKSRRMLRPALSSEAEARLVRAMVESRGGGVEIGLAEFRQHLADLLGSGGGTRRSQLVSNEVEATKARMERENFLQTMVFSALSIPDALMRRHFGVLQVVESIEAHVRAALDANRGDATGTEELQDSFEAMFGVRFRLAIRPATGDQLEVYERIPGEVLVQQLGYSLAQLADPMFRVDRKAVPTEKREEVELDSATTYFPSSIVPSTGHAAFREGALNAASVPPQAARQNDRTPVELYSVQLSDRLPFCIVAHSIYSIPGFESVGWDPVLSFAFWKNNAEVTKWLSRCETESFDGVWSTEDNNFGLGYMHPIFVTEPWREARDANGKRTSGLRWAPWGVSKQVLRERADGLDAILYALAGNLPRSQNESSKQAAKVIERVGQCEPAAGSGQRWSLPLLRSVSNGGRRSWELTRKSFRTDAGESMATGGSWVVAQKFQSLAEFIRWIGGPDPMKFNREGQSFVEAVNTERRLIRSEVLAEIGHEYAERRRDSVNKALLAFIDEYRDGPLASAEPEQQEPERALLDALRERISSQQWSWDRPPAT